MAGVTDSPNLAMGVGTDLFFSNNAFRWDSGIMAGSTFSASGVTVAPASNISRFLLTDILAGLSTRSSSCCTVLTKLFLVEVSNVLDGLGGP